MKYFTKSVFALVGLMLISVFTFGQNRGIVGDVYSNNEYNPGETADFVITWDLELSGSEWFSASYLEFPAGVTINSATRIEGISVSGNSGKIDLNNTNNMTATYVEWGETTTVTGDMNTSHGYVPSYRLPATAVLNLTFDAGLSGPLTVDFHYNGDGWGSVLPHYVQGSFVLNQNNNPADVVAAISPEATADNPFVTVEWNHAPVGYDEYKVYRDGGDGFELLATVGATDSDMQYDDYTVEDGMTYTYKVATVLGGEESSGVESDPVLVVVNATMVVDPDMYTWPDVGIFGDGTLTADPAEQMFTVTNIGIGDLAITAVYTFSLNSDEFVAENVVTTLGLNESTTFNVDFVPTSAGHKATLLVIETDAGVMTYDLYGNVYDVLEGDVIEDPFELAGYFNANEDLDESIDFDLYYNDYNLGTGADIVYTFDLAVDSYISVTGALVKNAAVFNAGSDLSAGNEIISGVTFTDEEIGSGSYVLVVNGSGDVDFTVHVEGADPIFAIDPDGTLDLGDVPINAWHRGGAFDVWNAGGQFFTIVDFQTSDLDDVWSYNYPINPDTDLPYDVYGGDILTFEYSLDADTEGEYIGNFIIEDEDDVRVYPVRGYAYDAPVGDIFENPFNVAFDGAGAYADAGSVALPMRNNYDVAGATTRDVVYRFELDEDKLMDFAYTGTNVELAVYNQEDLLNTAPTFVTPILTEADVLTDVEMNTGVYYIVITIEEATPDYTLDLQVDTMPVPGAFTLVAPADEAVEVSVTPTLEWTASEYAQSYNIYLGTTYPPALQEANYTGGLTYTVDEDLFPANVYFWYVEAVNTTGVVETDTWGFTTEIPAPRLVTATVHDFDDVLVEWQSPFETIDPLVEDFEGSFPPTGWSESSNSTSSTGGWTAAEDNGTENFDIPGHTVYASTNDDAAGDDGSVDYLFMPEVMFGNYDEVRLNFTSYYTGAYGQKATILITLDDGATFEEVAEVDAHGNWTDLTFDLDDYASADYNNARIVFHSDDNGGSGSGWGIDDVELELINNYGTGGAILGYNITQNGVQINTDLVDNLYYDVEDLLEGTYTFCVQAIFPEGPSAFACADPVYIAGRTEIFGYVYNADGAPIEGANIDIVGAEYEVMDILTDASGYYSSTVDGEKIPVIDGGYDVSCAASGWQSASVAGLMPTEATPIQQDFILGDIALPANNVVAVHAGTEDAEITWDPAGSGDLFEISYTYDDPANAYYQNWDYGYGVVFDLAAYGDATLATIDFHHSSYGVSGTWDYMIHVVNWDTYEEVAVLGPYQTTGDDIWETEVDLGMIAGLGGMNVGIIMEPMGNAADDAYPDLSSDNNTMDGLSVFGPIDDFAGMGESGIGDFLMDLWIITAMGGEPVMASKIQTPTGNHNAVARVEAPGYEQSGPYTIVNPQVRTLENNKSLQGHALYLLEADAQDDPTSWIPVADGIADGYYYDDIEFPNAEQGEWRYAVVAEYSINESEPAFSNIIGKDMLFEAMILVETNTGIIPEGAVVIMRNLDTGEFVEGAVNDLGYCQFNDPLLYKGNYLVEVYYPEYMEHISPVQWIWDDDYWIYEVMINEALCPVTDITASTDCASATIEWSEPEPCWGEPAPPTHAFTVEILTDNYGGETTWVLTGPEGTVGQGGPLESNTLYTHDYEIMPGDYTFTIYDSWGDGICCSYGDGYYNLILDGVTIASGGEFGAEESVNFNTLAPAPLQSVTTGYYAEAHGYAKGEVVANASELAVEYTTQEFSNRSTDVVLGYDVYQDGILVAPGTTEMTYTAEDLSNGMHEFKVIAKYETGDSEAILIEVEIAEIFAPVDLTAERESWNNVILTWNMPEFGGGGGTGGVTDAYIFHHNETYDSQVGYNGPGDFDVAARFTPAMLASYDGLYLTKISIWPAEADCEYSLRVWTGADAANMVVDQPIPAGDIVLNEWNEFELDTPVMIDANDELWIGYRNNANAGYPAGADSGPAYGGYGDMMFDGTSWVGINAAYGINRNWLITGYAISETGAPLALSPMSDVERTNTSSVVENKLEETLSADNAKDEQIGFRIEREHDVTGEVVTLAEYHQPLFYIDFDVPVQVGVDNTMTYTVTAVYSGACEASDDVDVFWDGNVEEGSASALNIYPNPATEVVNVELPANAETVKVLNTVGQVVYTAVADGDATHVINVENYAVGAYVIQVVTNNGDVMNQKVVITK